MKKALITGITGQDGSYLAELLLKKGYQIWGIIRRSSSFHTGRIDHLYKDPHNKPLLRLVYGDLTDGSNLSTIMNEIRPEEVYNLGAQSHVRVSFDMPIYTANTDALGTLRLLEAIRSMKKPAKFYQASSSEMYGKATEIPQTEKTPFYPRSPYGVWTSQGQKNALASRPRPPSTIVSKPRLTGIQQTRVGCTFEADEQSILHRLPTKYSLENADRAGINNTL